VEHGVGFGRRSFLVLIPKVASFAELNTPLLAECLKDDERQVDGQRLQIGAAWEMERPAFLPLPARDYACCVTRPVSLTPYSQVEFETNRYSVPADRVQPHLVRKAYPFRVDIPYLDEVLASHPRCYARHQDVFDPLHYLPFLEQHTGAFQHAKPLRRWRETWPPAYERLLARLGAEQTDGHSIREFVRVLRLHEIYPSALVQLAVGQALEHGWLHADGIELCVRQMLHQDAVAPSLDLAGYPRLERELVRPDLRRYEQLLVAGK
jgi:hypothetical protein